ncbi:cutinase, partial [Leptodontidium sp. MPI-SDFR-AT-0119]
MRFQAPTIVLVPLALASQINTLTSRADSECTKTHIFLAKGNNEPYPGRQGKLVNSICSGLSSCDYEDIHFYNPVESVYCDSVFEGVANGISQIIAYNKRCPDASLVISGYSQGAHIVGDILGGGGGKFFEGCIQGANEGLDFNSAAAKKISAVLIWASTRHTASQPYNVFTGANGQGLFPRPENQLAAMAQFTSVLHDYCVSTDPICAGGKEGPTHLNYFDLYSDVAAEWVKSQLSSAAEATTVVSSASSTASSAASSSTSVSASVSVSSTQSSLVTSLTASAIPTPTRSVDVTVGSASVSLTTSTSDSTPAPVST